MLIDVSRVLGVLLVVLVASVCAASAGGGSIQRVLGTADLAAGPDLRERRDATSGRDEVDGLERAEQSHLALTAVQARRRQVAGGKRLPVRPDLHGRLRGHPRRAHLARAGPSAG